MPQTLFENTILIVDDVKENIDILNGLLADFKRKVAINGKKALDIAFNQPVDIILMDVMMPEMDGYTACEELRKNESTRDIPVIFLTAKSEQDDVAKGFQVGGQDYVSKPFDPNELMARVKAQLNLRMQAKTIKQQKNDLEKGLKDLKEAESQMLHNEKMASVGVLSAGISHEINNPVNFMYGGSQSLRENFADLREFISSAEKVIEDPSESNLQKMREISKKSDIDDLMKDSDALIKGIEEGGRRTMDIVQGLKNFSRIDESEKKLADIHEGLDSTLTLLTHEYKNRIEIVKNYGDIPQVMIYAGQLNQVFMNLLGNAIQAIEGKGIIEITTSKNGESIEISIKDSGKGIPDDLKSKIFEPFFTTKDVGKGTGLGLSISFGIIEKHGGEILVDSEEGKGTEFTIKIPSNT